MPETNTTENMPETNTTEKCSACENGTSAYLCDICLSKTKRVYSAGRGTVNWAARRTLRVVATKCADVTFIEEWYEFGRAAGRDW